MVDPGPGQPPRRAPTRYERGGEEFSRVLAFSDGLFAIAMTLLVVGITAPTLREANDEAEMVRALHTLTPEIISFAVSFLVIGRYWRAHHQFFAMLRAVDPRLITINLVYLAFIAFLPFPTDLLGNYFHNPISVAIYAATVAAVSGLEVVMFRHARRFGLLGKDLPGDVYRWAVLVSALPVVVFVASVPVAFYHAGLAVTTWFLFVPLEWLAGHRKPPGTDDYLN